MEGVKDGGDMAAAVVGRGVGAAGAGKFELSDIILDTLSHIDGSSVSSAAHAAFINKIVSDLKSRNELDRHRAAR